MAKQHQATVKPPYTISYYYPTTLSRTAYRSYNGLFNRLYPIKPLIFGSSLAAATAYHIRNPDNLLMNSLRCLGNKALQTGIASFLTAYTPVFLIRCFLKYWYFSYKAFLFENPKNPSLTTKCWFILKQLLDKFCPPKLCSTAGLLPNIHVPKLQDTVRRYLETIEPILSKEEYDDVVAKSQKFLTEEGPKLQRYAKLMSYFTDNYVTGFWEKYAYLYGRNCLLVNSSVAHCDLIEDRAANQAVRAAHVVYIEALSMLAMDRQRLKPIGGGLVSTNHYDNCYAGNRVPGVEIDVNVNYGVSRHVAVLCRGCFYKIELFDQNGKIFTPEQLSEVFKELLRRTDQPTEGEADLAALTTDQRDLWSKNRTEFFLADPKNRESLEMIESSAVFLVLEETGDYGYNPEKPEVLDNFLRNMLTGDGRNRWADKSLNYIVAKNGRCGGTTEHSIGDGAEFDHIMENFVYMDNMLMNYPAVVEDIYADKDWTPSAGLRLAERYSFNIGEPLKAEIDRCLNTYDQLRDDVDFAATVFTDWGKNKIKEGKCSPDGFLQMAIQLASFRDQGKFSLTYESASQRFYANSRTETLRPVTKDSCAFVRAMEDAQCSKAERLQLLRKACELHVYRNKECMVGRGVDRHLFVLYVLSRGTNTSSPFLDYYINQPWILSTSQPPVVTGLHDEDKYPERSWLGACFGPVAKEGYGICYRFAGNHSICAHITSLKSAANTDSHRFQTHLKNAFHEMADLFTEEQLRLPN